MSRRRYFYAVAAFALLAVPLGMGGLMVGTFLWQLGKRPLVFEYEVKYAEGLAHE